MLLNEHISSEIYLYHSTIYDKFPQSIAEDERKQLALICTTGPLKAPISSGGKWCKILHSGHILAHKSQLQIVGFFY
jgi:hypothetical protein